MWGPREKWSAAVVVSLLLLPCVTCLLLLRVICVTHETLTRTLRRSLHCQSVHRSGAPRRLPFFAALWRHHHVCGPEQRLVLQQWLDGHHPERGWDALSAAQPRSGSCLLSRCCSTSRCSGPQTRRCRHNAAKKGSRRGAPERRSDWQCKLRVRVRVRVSCVTQVSLNSNKHVIQISYTCLLLLREICVT